MHAHDYRQRVQRRRLIAIAVYLVTSVLALLLIAGHGPWAGRVLFRVSESHGFNTGDVPVILLWAAAMACCAALWRDTR
ncbi:hypothetical protein I601_1803 [Nocardioides dokdonensis FR1436]|uniref:Uncharacterized protein n=1 Tax=Nocardioides dokdonensis FR1436 TaxID=1300347 RepID=A0A1A9GJ16_9ACTN|nr:hypothetical protein I601_1803 [Nocardioides dokdonensis FR1436]